MKFINKILLTLAIYTLFRIVAEKLLPTNWHFWFGWVAGSLYILLVDLEEE